MKNKMDNTRDSRNQMKEKYLKAFMDMTERFGQTSTSNRLKVGACMIKDGNPICFGVNGTRPGWPTNDCEDEHGNTTPAVRHAEIACLDKLRKIGETSVGAHLLVSHAPCFNCSIEIIDAGITKVYYRHIYRSPDGLANLQRHGVQVVRVE